MEWTTLAVLPISNYELWLHKQIRHSARKEVNKANRSGVVTEVLPFTDSLVHSIRDIYNESPIRRGRRFSHFGKDFSTVYAEAATYLEWSTFIGAFLEGKMIGFIKLVVDETRSQASLMNILSMARHRDVSPTNALLAHAVRFCAERGIRYLVYGPMFYGKNRHDSLTHFKQHNGFEQVDTPRYYVPLTPLGGLVFRLRLHHRLAEYVPESLAARLRDLRRNWYERKLPSSAEVS
jgi:hypothetical protein